MTTLTATATAVKRQILASKIDVARSLNNEAALKWELTRFFQDLRDKVLKEMDEYYPTDETGVLLEGQLDLILAPIFESQKRYYNILRRFNSKEYTFGSREAKRLVKLAKSRVNGASKSQSDTFKPESLINIEKDELFATLDWSRDQLQNQTFTASEHTINRVDKDINKILTDGYTSGKGIHAVRDDITRRFGQLADWEANRIARTEIHNAHQIGIMNTYHDLGVEYIQWSSAHDWRVRGMKKKDKANHVILDGEIIPLGGTFSNGLMHPGDRTGKIEEWINCRCSAIPFIIPDGYIAPTFSPFKEKDLIPTLDAWNADDLIIQATSEVGSNQLKIKNNSKSNHVKQFNLKKQTPPNIKLKEKREVSNYESNPQVKHVPEIHKDPNKMVVIDGKKVYGVGENPNDKIAFEERYGIKESELSKEELKFIKLYSGDGFSLLNSYLREIALISNHRLLKMKKAKYSIKWLKLIFKYPKNFISFDKSLKVLEKVFDKGKILEEDIVVVRRQRSSMLKYAKDGIYHSDSCLSTSISENVKPEEYGEYVNYIVISEGTKILYIEGITTTVGEYEILLDKNIDLDLINEKSRYETHWRLKG